jgi:hypothetical protein
MKSSAVFALALVLTAAGAANAGPTRKECIQASEDAQLLRIKAQLVSARAKLVECSSDACPKVVRKDCSGWLDEVDRALPTVVLGARDSRGKDLTDVHVTLDGAALVDRLDGKAVAIDPGAHTLRFETAGEPAHEEKIVVREGEKNRIVSVVIGKAAPGPSQPVPVVVTVGPTPPAQEGRAPSVATWIVGGVGLATLAAAGIIGTASLVQRQNLFDSCGSTGSCQQSDVDQVYLMYDLAYGGAAVGGALVLTGVVLFFATRPGARRTTGVLVTPSLGGVSVLGRF